MNVRLLTVAVMVAFGPGFGAEMALLRF